MAHPVDLQSDLITAIDESATKSVRQNQHFSKLPQMLRKVTSLENYLISIN